MSSCRALQCGVQAADEDSELGRNSDSGHGGSSHRNGSIQKHASVLPADGRTADPANASAGANDLDMAGNVAGRWRRAVAHLQAASLPHAASVHDIDTIADGETIPGMYYFGGVPNPDHVPPQPRGRSRHGSYPDLATKVARAEAASMQPSASQQKLASSSSADNSTHRRRHSGRTTKLRLYAEALFAAGMNDLKQLKSLMMRVCLP